MQIVLIFMFFHGNVLYETLLAGWLAGWLAHNIAGWQTSKFLITLAGLRNCSVFNRACWLKPVTHDRWLGILFPESLAS